MKSRTSSAKTADSFTELRLLPSTMDALSEMGIIDPTPIQSATLPVLLAGGDVIGQARTGSGKTLAFLIPAVELVDVSRPVVQVLVLTPTRELAVQIDSVLDLISGDRGIRSALIFGGRAAGPQISALRRGVHVVIGTPGRVLDLLNQRVLTLDRVRLLVLDEADEMLDRGFAPDVERILAATPRDRQTALFSATVPVWVRQTADKHLDRPTVIEVDGKKGDTPAIDHVAFDVQDGDKVGALKELLDLRGSGSIIVFGRTKHGVKKLARRLEQDGYPVGALQGNLSQNARDRVMEQFRTGEVQILLATNVAARGLDITSVDQVINLDLPESPELMTHRIGRTGRMGREGSAITLLAPEDSGKWRDIERALGRRVPRSTWSGAAAALGLTDVPPTSMRPIERPTPQSRPEHQTSQASASVRSSPQTRRPEARTGRHEASTMIWADGRSISSGPARHADTQRKQPTAIVCSNCGQPSEVPFRPDPTRPVYCSDCHSTRRNRRAPGRAQA